MQADETEQPPTRALMRSPDQVEGGSADTMASTRKRGLRLGIGVLEDHLDAAAQFLPRLRLLRVGHRHAVDGDRRNSAAVQRPSAPRWLGADSPTSAKVSPRPMSKVTPSTALRIRVAAFQLAVSHGFETSKTRRRFLTSTAHAALSWLRHRTGDEADRACRTDRAADAAGRRQAQRG